MTTFAVTGTLADMAEWKEAFNVYRGFFTKELPARSGYATAGLALGARLEIECMVQVAKR